MKCHFAAGTVFSLLLTFASLAQTASEPTPSSLPFALVPAGEGESGSQKSLPMAAPALAGLPADLLLPIAEANAPTKSEGGSSRFAATLARENEALAPVFTGLTATPNTGNDRTFTLTLQDPNGKADIRNIYLIFNDSLRASESCFLFVQAQSKTLSLANDRATDWTAAPQPAGRNQTLSNSFCSLNAANLTFEPAGSSSDPNTLTVQFRVQFADAVSGTKSVYFYADDMSGNFRPWQLVSSVALNSSAAPAVCCATVLPRASDAQSAAVELRFTLTHPSLVGDISRAYLILNTSLVGSNGCLVELDFRSRTARLANDAASDWLPRVGQITLTGSTNSDGLLSNQQCELGSEAIGAMAISDRQLLVRVQVRLKQWANSTNRLAYLFVENRTGASAQWQLLQTITKQSNGAVVATPSPTGNSPKFEGLVNPLNYLTMHYLNFSSLFSDEGGPAELSRLYVLVGSDFSARNGCLVELNWKSGVLRLADPTGSSWLETVYQKPEVNQPGPTQLQNANCAVGQAYSYSAGILQMVSNLTITAKPLLAGPVPVQVMAVDNSGNSSEWSQIAVWDIPPEVPPFIHSFREFTPLQTTRRFQFQMNDRNGNHTIASSKFIIGSSTSSFANSCVVQLLPSATGTLIQLANDAGAFTDALTFRYTDQGTTNLRNSQCALLFASSSTPRPESYDGLFVDLQFQFAASYFGSFSSFAEAKDVTGATSDWNYLGPITIVPPGAPLNLTVTGVAANAAFPKAYRVDVAASGPSMSSDMLIDLMVGEGPTGTRNCWIQHSTKEQLYRLNTDAGDTLSTITAPAVAPDGRNAITILSNSRCSLLSVEPGRFSTTRGSLEIYAHMKSALAGTNRVFARATDRANSATSGWIQIGSVDTPSVTPLPEAYASAGITLNNTKSIRSLVTSVTDRSGIANYKNLYVIVNRSLSNVGGCFLWLDYQRREIRLAKADGSTWQPEIFAFGYGGPNPSPRLENENCEMQWARSYLGPISGQTEMVLRAKASLAGLQKIFVYGETVDGRNTGWQQSAEEDFGPAQVASLTVFPDPVAGTMNRGQIRLTASSGIRPEDVNDLQLYFGDQPPVAANGAGCTLRVNFPLFSLSVSSISASAGTDLIDRRDIDNDKCRFLTTRSAFGRSDEFGNTAMYGLFDFELKDTQPTTYKVFASAGLPGNALPWRQIGTWRTQGNPSPMGKGDPAFPVRITGSATTSIPLTFDDPNGIADLGTGYFLIRSNSGTSNACFLALDFVNRQIRLANDSGQGWLATSAVFGNPATGVSNSQCTLVGSTVESFAAQNQMKVTLQLRFQPSLNGVRLPGNLRGRPRCGQSWVDEPSPTRY